MAEGLAPHPWDKWGKPPRPGYRYEVAAELETLIEPALSAARHLVYEDEERAEAERHEEAADEYANLARPFLAKLPEDLADAIREDPQRFNTADDVLKAARDAA